MEIACPTCEETGKDGRGETCGACGGGGYVSVDASPRKYIGWELTRAVNLAGLAAKGMLPVHGSVLDQSAWFVNMWTTLENDQNKIDAERQERSRHGR